MNNLTVIYKKAVDNQPRFKALLERVGQDTSGKVVVNLKNPQTADKKVKEKNEEEPNRNYKLSDVNDILRGRLVYVDEKQMKEGIKDFENKAHMIGVMIDKKEDFFKKPEDGYRGYHIDVKFPNGQVSEVQFHTINSYAASLQTHAVHATYSSEAPHAIALKTEKLNDRIMNMPKRKAATIAVQNEAKNMPVQLQSQVAAQQQAQQQINPADLQKAIALIQRTRPLVAVATGGLR